VGLRSGKTWLSLLAPWMLAAAILILVVSVYMLNTEHKAQSPAVLNGKKQTPLLPEKDQAVLTLADGRTIILDGTHSGVLAAEGNTEVIMNPEGALVYQGGDETTGYHTLSVPRGSQYQLLLGDGTRVWLNAESTLRYPVAFTGKERKLELKGEGYFEVAKNARKPFIVALVRQGKELATVTALGTKFNINAYESDPLIRTSLEEGSIQVDAKGVSRIVQPGEQAIIKDGIQITQTDIQAAVAWKNGQFLFRDATIYAIGEQIRRWYDVEVTYKDTIPLHFNATIGRHETLSRLLQILEGTGQVRFMLDGRKLTIQP
jgi:transmembrane sensor